MSDSHLNYRTRTVNRHAHCQTLSEHMAKHGLNSCAVYTFDQDRLIVFTVDSTGFIKGSCEPTSKDSNYLKPILFDGVECFVDFIYNV